MRFSSSKSTKQPHTPLTTVSVKSEERSPLPSPTAERLSFGTPSRNKSLCESKIVRGGTSVLMDLDEVSGGPRREERRGDDETIILPSSEEGKSEEEHEKEYEEQQEEELPNLAQNHTKSLVTATTLSTRPDPRGGVRVYLRSCRTSWNRTVHTRIPLQRGDY